MVDSTTTATMSYAFDKADRLASMTVPSGQTIDMAYDSAGRRVSVAFGNALVTKAEFEPPFPFPHRVILGV